MCPTFPIKSVPQVLFDYFTSNPDCSFRKYHDLPTPKSSKNKVVTEEYNENYSKLMSDFLFSTLDEVRVRKANEFAEKVMYTANMQDADYFRLSLLRKEIVGDIDYQKHRDHAGHTVYNYLLGWYIFDNISPIRETFRVHLKKNFIDGYEPTEDDMIKFFGNSWLLVSLLHDIGYIFEGSLNTLDTESYNDKIRRGSTIIHDFFHHRFWFDLNIDSQSGRYVLNKILNLESGNFADIKSLVALGDILVSVGNVNQIINYSINVETSGKLKTLADKSEEFSLALDSFELWEKYFDRVNMPIMKERMVKLKTVYKELLYSGLKGEGTRLIDHGIASGLILLLYLTHFYKLYFTLKSYAENIENVKKSNHLEDNAPRKSIIEAYFNSPDYNPENSPERLQKNEINILIQLIKSINDYIPEHYKYSARYWCTGVLWSTASVAFHNILQDPKEFFENTKGRVIGKLSVQGDSLTYLGILVDIIEEWDRYQVVPENIFGGNLPIQGIDVEIGVSAGTNKLKVNYFNKKITKKVGDSLSKSLDDWQKFIKIEEYEPDV